MEVKFKSLSIFEFQERFPDEDSCYQYLADLKWPNGYVCKKCGNEYYSKGRNKHDRQCTRCHYSESPTAGTLFHHIKFPLLKAFWIVYYMATSKKGISSTELSRKLSLRQKTVWYFQRKVREAMKSSGNHPLDGEVIVDETVVGQQEEGTRGRKNKKKKLVVIAIEKKSKGASRLYAKHISRASAKEIGNFMHAYISPGAIIRTDGWTAYIPLKKDFPNLTQEKSEKKGKNFALIHRVIMGFKSWLRGIHHHASFKYLQLYLDEYAYRFNRHFMKENIFDNLLNRMMQTKPIISHTYY